MNKINSNKKRLLLYIGLFFGNMLLDCKDVGSAAQPKKGYIRKKITATKQGLGLELAPIIEWNDFIAKKQAFQIHDNAFLNIKERWDQYKKVYDANLQLLQVQTKKRDKLVQEKAKLGITDISKRNKLSSEISAIEKEQKQAKKDANEASKNIKNLFEHGFDEALFVKRIKGEFVEKLNDLHSMLKNIESISKEASVDKQYSALMQNADIELADVYKKMKIFLRNQEIEFILIINEKVQALFDLFMALVNKKPSLKEYSFKTVLEKESYESLLEKMSRPLLGNDELGVGIDQEEE